ncbi:MAG: DUF2167 domain-containing protein [Chlorobiaceae bacterium]
MKISSKIPIVFIVLVLTTSTAFSQDEDIEAVIKRVQWVKGPAIGNLGNTAEIRVPEGYIFASGDDTRQLLEAMHNPTDGTEVGFIASTSSNWFMFFNFKSIGYVSDEEKNSLDAGAMLRSIITATEKANNERIKRGWSTVTVIGWQQEPHYNSETHNLEWSLLGQDKGEQIVNWNTRLLGRKGIMSVTLVTNPSTISNILPECHKLLADFSYKQGNRYEEYRSGDKLSELGLTALVVGAGSAVAVKTGLAKWLWKVLVAAFAAICLWLKKLFTKKKQ